VIIIYEVLFIHKYAKSGKNYNGKLLQDMVFKTMDVFTKKIFFKEIWRDLIYEIHEEKNSFTRSKQEMLFYWRHVFSKPQERIIFMEIWKYDFIYFWEMFLPKYRIPKILKLIFLKTKEWQKNQWFPNHFQNLQQWLIIWKIINWIIKGLYQMMFNWIIKGLYRMMGLINSIKRHQSTRLWTY